MSWGGKRENSGRKKIGDKQVKIVLPTEIIDEISVNFQGNTLATKVRNCIEKGLISKKEVKNA